MSKNIYYLFDQLPKIPIDIEKIKNLLTFLSLNDEEKKVSNIENIMKENNKYYYFIDGKKYYFSLLTDENIQIYDKNNINNEKENILGRTLKLACSLDLVNPRVVVGSSSLMPIKTLILYGINDNEMVIDYAKNIIMKKKDYYELFGYKEINVVPKSDLYYIYEIIRDYGNAFDTYELLIFTKEILKNLGNTNLDEYLIFKENYDYNGYNKNNYCFIGTNSDFLFFIDEDYERKNEVYIQKIIDFTENPNEMIDGIKKINDYRYSIFVEGIGDIEFSLLSDSIDDEELKIDLLSDQRYGNCHENSAIIASINSKIFKDVYLVAGKLKNNDVDYYYHSWVEVPEVNAVADFNHNIIMKKEDYYKLFGAVKINEIHESDMKYLYSVLYSDKFNFIPSEINYFGEEIMRDLQKNAKVLNLESKEDFLARFNKNKKRN